MISFECDYLEGCHEKVLSAIVATNMQQEPGYGADRFTQSAKAKIREACQCPEADIYFLNGGTQTNQVVIDTMLAPYEGVMAAETGHVSTHEAGAIEFSGHKVLTLPSHEGKVKADEVAQFVDAFYSDGNHEHMVFPGMLYISFPTEYGTLYSAAELKELSKVCRERGLHFFIDGARLGYGLMAKKNDVTLPLLASLCDVFYIGGTKVGALCGEAVVFPEGSVKTPGHFIAQIKQHGALSAKGRLNGIQFDALFTDGLYWDISAHAIEMAMQIREIFAKAKVPFYLDSPTNQQFVILEDEKMAELAQQVRFGFWEKYDTTHTVVRFASSWATTQEQVDALAEIVEKILE